MPNQPRPGVTPRQVRVPDDLWHAARATAARRGETVADILRQALETYVTNNNESAPAPRDRPGA